jgi:hypothetical protein
LPFRALSVLIESVALIELIFNLHSLVGFRCRVPLLLASFLRATNGMRGWIRRPDFGLRGPDATRRDNHPCSHRRAADLDRFDRETSRSSGARPGASSHPESARTLPRKRLSALGRSKNEGHRNLCALLFQRGLPTVEGFSSPRAWAFALLDYPAPIGI